MKAIRLHSYGPADTLRLEEAPLPALTPDTLLVRVHAASVNHVDRLKGNGILQQFYPLDFPWIPGGDFAGTVEATGDNITGFAPGDAVYGNCPGGAYAEYVVVTTAALGHKPASLSFTEAAGVPVAAQTAWQGVLEEAKLQAGETILIHGGAGAIGAYAVQLARRAGATVITTANGADAAYLQTLGADRVIDYTSTRFETVVGKVDVVFDLVGGAVQERSFGVLQPGGRLITVNQPVLADLAAAHGVTGIFMHLVPSSERLQQLAALFDSGALKTDVARVYPLADVARAWNDLSGNLYARELAPADKRHGKLILQID